MEVQRKPLVISIDFDGNVIDENGTAYKERCDIIKRLIEKGADIYILTASLSPYLIETNMTYIKTAGYYKLKQQIKQWLNDNITMYDWHITPIKNHKTDYYLDVNSIQWEQAEDFICNNS